MIVLRIYREHERWELTEEGDECVVLDGQMYYKAASGYFKYLFAINWS